MLALLLIATVAAADSCPIVREFRAPSPDGHVLAAEVISRGGSKRPTVVLISGAGPQTRDYSTDLGSDTSGNRAFAVITAGLLDAGYAVVRFDERGTGRSTGDYAASATTATLADDVERVLAAAKGLREVDAKRFVLLGHSEGTNIAMLVASRGAPVGALAGARARGPDRDRPVVSILYRLRSAASRSQGARADLVALW